MKFPFVIWLASEIGWPVAVLACIAMGLLAALGWVAAYYLWKKQP